MTLGPLDTPQDILTAAGRLLAASGTVPAAGVVVDLDPLFAHLFLGSDIRSLDRLVNAAAHAHGWLVPQPGPGRRYALTEAGAVRLRSVPRRMWSGLSGAQRLMVAVLVLAALLAAVVLTR